MPNLVFLYFEEQYFLPTRFQFFSIHRNSLRAGVNFEILNWTTHIIAIHFWKLHKISSCLIRIWDLYSKQGQGRRCRYLACWLLIEKGEEELNKPRRESNSDKGTLKQVFFISRETLFQSCFGYICNLNALPSY